jgi:Glycosyl hydrolases family 2, TIM barrel domain/GDSL-like Lipase/Acylhydrolase family/Glycosyl hydrolases family 2
MIGISPCRSGKPAEIVFDGDSITNRWETTGKATWSARYADRAADFGIEGDRIENLLWRLSKGQVTGINPKVVVLMIGTNNVGRNTPDQIAGGIKAAVAGYETLCPNAHIILMAVFPRGKTANLRNDSDLEVSVDINGAVHRWISLAPKEGVDAANPDWKLDPSTSLALQASKIAITAHGQQTVQIEEKVKSSLDAWSPDSPTLYGLVLGIGSGGHQIDCKYQRFGWRQFKFDGPQLQLNGHAITLKGDSWHFLGVPQMTRRYARAWFSAMHDANLNAVRLHAEPYPEFYLDVADEMGIMVLDETAIWASDGGPKLDSAAFWEDTKGQVEQLVYRDRNHPSVFGWSVCNEMRPIVQGVFHNPPGMMQQLVAYYAIWAEICRRLDPTRPWISADGDDDGGGKLPVYVVHYGGTASMERAAASGKPWGVGEAGGAYYATPLQAAKTNGERAYASFAGRMEGIAIDSYSNLLSQRKLNAGYRSIFNLVWYWWCGELPRRRSII